MSDWGTTYIISFCNFGFSETFTWHQLKIKDIILEGNQLNFLPIYEPLREELIEHGYIDTDENGQEVQVKSYPSVKEWGVVKGFNTNYELPESFQSEQIKYTDNNIQCLLFPRELEAHLRNIRTKANTAIEETGANILYLAFGFLGIKNS